MVRIKRKDKRLGNKDLKSIFGNLDDKKDGIVLAGRFAADMRVTVGGYGRPRNVLAADHPWHVSGADGEEESEMWKDKMEEGVLLEEEKDEPQQEAGRGMSRAAMKRLKKKKKNPVQAKEETDDKSSITKPAKESKFAKDSSNKTIASTAGKKEKRALDEKRSDKQSKKRKRVEPQLAKRNVLPDDEDDEEGVNAGPVPVIPAATQRKDALHKNPAEDAQEEIEGAEDLILEDVKQGQGRSPVQGEQVTIRYRGTLGKPGTTFGKGLLTFHVGVGEVIVGLSMGVATMREGGRRKITVPPELGYGHTRSMGQKIPSGSTLHFDVELVRVGKRQRDKEGNGEEKDDSTVIEGPSIPLPRDFTRKRKQAQGSGATNGLPKATAKRGEAKPAGEKKKRKRRGGVQARKKREKMADESL